jgi:hypothetical protein
MTEWIFPARNRSCNATAWLRWHYPTWLLDTAFLHSTNSMRSMNVLPVLVPKQHVTACVSKTHAVRAIGVLQNAVLWGCRIAAAVMRF